MKYTFSGHESFTCKSLWLKKGYDYIYPLSRTPLDSILVDIDKKTLESSSFTNPKAVISLGVGKNMVSSIRFWMKAFGVSSNDRATKLGDYLFDSIYGKDQYLEYEGSLWVLHYFLIESHFASIYSLAFLEMRHERQTFTKVQLNSFIKRKCLEHNCLNSINDNTLNKDISVFLNSYIKPSNPKSLDGFMTLLIELNLIQKVDKDTYQFTQKHSDDIPLDVFFFAILDHNKSNKTISFEQIQDLGLIFGLSNGDIIETLREIGEAYPKKVMYSDNSGIRQLQLLTNIDQYDILDHYYTYENE